MSKAKKITVFSVVGVVLALVLVVIILACVPSYFNNFVGKRSSSITVYNYNNGINATFVNKPDAFTENNYKSYLKLNDAVEKASSEKVLTAMFQGSYKFESKLIEKKRTASQVKSLLQTKDCTFLIFNYKNQEQSVTIDGTEVKYYSIIMEVDPSDYLKETKVVFVKNVETSVDNMESDYETSFLAKQDELYDLIMDLI